MRRALAVAIVLLAAGVAVAAGIVRSGDDGGARCGEGFRPTGARCMVAEEIGPDGGHLCPPPLVPAGSGCDAPDVRVLVPTSTLLLGPSDWEAEGRVPIRSVSVGAFRIDAFEVTRRRWDSVMHATQAGGGAPDARAKSDVSLGDARAFCRAVQGDLPTEDQWMAAAASATSPPRRYPWGDTGAVCRRAAWGLQAGPCASGADGPDTVGAHPDGDSPLRLHDLAGNIAEWVLAPVPAAKGGSWATSEASGLRVWARLELSGSADPRVGLRCVYPL